MNGFDPDLVGVPTSLSELYAKMPVEEHGNIVVTGGRVYVRIAGGTEEYLLLHGGEVKLVRSDKANPLTAIHQDLAAIKAKLGIPG